MLISDIISAIEDVAPSAWQEDWDNTGLQVGDATAECTGVLIAVDVTPAVVDEAVRRGCNLIVSHHPLIFRGLKQIVGDTPLQTCVIRAIAAGVSIYSSHTALDNAPDGVSRRMAHMLGIDVDSTLTSVPAAPHGVGTGVVGTLRSPMNPADFIAHVKRVFDAPVARCTHINAAMTHDTVISRVALCGGSGGEFIPAAVAAGAQAYVSGDIRYHDFVDRQSDILLVDIGHFETEQCTKDIFYQIISQKFANFAVYKSQDGLNPVIYM